MEKIKPIAVEVITLNGGCKSKNDRSCNSNTNAKLTHTHTQLSVDTLLFINEERQKEFFLMHYKLRNVKCLYKNDNIEELKKVLNNGQLYESLEKLEDMILQTLEQDALKIPIIRHDTVRYIDMTNFKEVHFKAVNNEDRSYIVPTFSAEAEDIIKYEHALKIQITLDYKPEISDLIKKKTLIVRTLKIIKIMQIPMKAYRKTNNLKDALEELNNIFTNSDDDNTENKTSSLSLKRRIFEKNSYSSSKTKKKISLYMPIDVKTDVINYNDLLFTYQPSITLMKKLDTLSNYYDLGVFNYVGSHFIALGHFITLKLALKHYKKYFETGILKFYNWQSILQFNHADRFKVLDLICDECNSYEGDIKRREQYLKNNILSTSEECSILEFLLHHMNKYQMELYSNASKLNLNLQVMLETDHMREKYFDFVCKDGNECNIYDSPKFKDEEEKQVQFKDEHNYTFTTSKTLFPVENNPFDVYINYFNFIKYYNEFDTDQVLYLHLLNLIGILSGDINAFVSSLYLPGYYNAIQLAYEDNLGMKELYDNLVKCVGICYIRESKKRSMAFKITSIFGYTKFDTSKCNICEGTLFYINNQVQDSMSMLQKFYGYTTKVLKINIISSLIRQMQICDDYNNFLMHDLNWFTFLFLFHIPSHSISNAMYLNLKDEDNQKKTMVTYHWYPSYLKKFITNYVRKNESVNLLEELENLLSKDMIEKMKKCIRFVMHVNSILQMDFFYYLNETPVRDQHPFGLTMLIEGKFKDWFINYLTGFTLINYEEPNSRFDMPEKKEKREFITPKYSMWTLHMRTLIEQAYLKIFNQKHVVSIFKYFAPYNISNKILLMRDTYELYLKNFDQIHFTGDIMLLSKFFGATPKISIIRERLNYFLHSIHGNPVNYYKFGIIYAYTINKALLKEIVDELFVIYSMNKVIFTEISFLQTVRLLFKKIQHSFFSHRRNDNISMNNIFFFNVRKDYSKLSKEQREQEIHDSMASRFFEKTMFTLFQIMFAVRLSKHINKLDRMYGKANMMRYSVHEEPHLRFEYVYNGSMLDNLLNVFFPMYIKKPVIQLKYGKTFILANMYKLASELFALYHLNNLSLLCEYQAVTTANYHSFKKMSQFIDKKFIPIVIAAFYLKIRSEMKEAGKDIWKAYKEDRLEGGKFSQFLVYKSIYMAGNALYRNILFFPNHLPDELRKQTKGLVTNQPNEKPGAHNINGQVIFGVVHSLSVSFFIFNLMRWYAFYDNVIFMFRVTFRLFDRFYTILDTYVKMFIKRFFNRYTVDAFLKSLSRIYSASKKEGYLEEVMESRIAAKAFNEKEREEAEEEEGKTDVEKETKKEEKEKDKKGVPLLQPLDIESTEQNSTLFYKDNNSYFEGLEENEEFLNDRDIIYYEDNVDKRDLFNLVPMNIF
ncbi:cytoadherence linked asexual protein (CLAG), putative [Plasmodium ovale curtisi]|uniref:Cytoadherence linked asexual protein (CLAG), putative n=1 Tax=Plasmodium ovale curtisi TaxID=864141 RepID=A0A1A8WT24_PLAOA|nr:cytoadherence linked asexual protein (CLAG), putative [Plasmodium ovale curtisi]